MSSTLFKDSTFIGESLDMAGVIAELHGSVA